MSLFKLSILSLLAASALTTTTQATTISTIEEYDQQLPVWGTSWTPGDYSINGYHPSFYTGFAPRIETPERIHIHMARGNQTRVSLILDENTVTNYLFDLVARANFYKKVAAAGLMQIAPAGAKFTPQEQFFQQIVDSPVYGIRKFVEQEAALKSPEEVYARSLAILKSLNANRFFAIRLDLRKEFIKWKTQYLPQIGSRAANSPQDAAVAINTLVLGRTNLTAKPTEAQMAKLKEVLELARNGSEDQFVLAARDLFILATGSKYKMKVLNSLNQWENPVQCESATQCFLVYPEFTAVYPMGSLKSTRTDKFGNKVPAFSLAGLWEFTALKDADVDNISPAFYYGWIPKLDYQDKNLGYGFHNPSVRFYEVDPAIKRSLAIPVDHNTFWSVKRGGVSHGCSRLPAGHNWELRHVMPVESAKMAKVFLYANTSLEFDVYDIDGDGQAEVMGVQYLLSYDLQGTDGLMAREGTALAINKEKKNEFYAQLYGAKNVFVVNGNGFTFKNPEVAVHTFADYKSDGLKKKIQLQDDAQLFEQAYERDKLQFFTPVNVTDINLIEQHPVSKRFIRLLGRVRGCSPTSPAASCGQTAFETEAASIFSELGKSW